MSRERASLIRGPVFNLPNQLTSLRLLLAVILFGFITAEYYTVSFVLFIVAAGTDWLDGYFARRYGQVTTLGRILDPFADKVIICGTFTFLLVAPGMGETPYGLRAWMVVVVVGRELLVTALRSFIEDRGGDFSATMSGKLKMVLQCVAAAAGIFVLRYADPHVTTPEWVATVPLWVRGVFVGSLWAAVLLTVYSGLIYIQMAVRLLREN